MHYIAIKNDFKKRFKKIIPSLTTTHAGISENRYNGVDIGLREKFKNTKFSKRISNRLMDFGTRFIGAGFLTDAVIKTIETELSHQGLLGYELNLDDD